MRGALSPGFVPLYGYSTRRTHGESQPIRMRPPRRQMLAARAPSRQCIAHKASSQSIAKCTLESNAAWAAAHCEVHTHTRTSLPKPYASTSLRVAFAYTAEG